MRLRLRDSHGQTSFDSFVQISKKLIYGFALSGATGDGRHLGPVSTLFRFVYYDFDLHQPLPQLLDAEPVSDPHWHHDVPVFESVVRAFFGTHLAGRLRIFELQAHVAVA